MREFLLNSRHPGPRREEGGQRAAVQMPLPRDPGDPRDCVENSGRLDSMRRHWKMDTFAWNWASNFRQISENRPVHPKAPQGTPKGPPRDPRGTQWGPQGSQVQQNETQLGAKIAKGTPKPVQGQPKQAKRTNYTSTNSRSTACAAVML